MDENDSIWVCIEDDRKQEEEEDDDGKKRIPNSGSSGDESAFMPNLHIVFV